MSKMSEGSVFYSLCFRTTYRIFCLQVPTATSIKKRIIFENKHKNSLVYKIFIQLLLFQQAYAHNDNGDTVSAITIQKINTSA